VRIKIPFTKYELAIHVLVNPRHLGLDLMLCRILPPCHVYGVGSGGDIVIPDTKELEQGLTIVVGDLVGRQGGDK